MGDQYISVTDRHNGSQIHICCGLYSIVTVSNCHCEVLMLFPCCLELIISTLWWVVWDWHFRVLTLPLEFRQSVVVVVVVVLVVVAGSFYWPWQHVACLSHCSGGTINGRFSSHEILAHSAPTVSYGTRRVSLSGGGPRIAVEPFL